MNRGMIARANRIAFFQNHFEKLIYGFDENKNDYKTLSFQLIILIGAILANIDVFGE